MAGLVTEEFGRQHREMWRSRIGRKPRIKRHRSRTRANEEGEFILHERVNDLVTWFPATLLRHTRNPSIEIVFEGSVNGKDPSENGDCWELAYNGVYLLYEDPVDGIDTLLPSSINATTLKAAIVEASGIPPTEFAVTAFPGRYFIEAYPGSTLDVDRFYEEAEEFVIYRRRIEWARHSTRWIKAAHLGNEESFSPGNFCHGRRRLGAMRVVSTCRRFSIYTGNAPDPDGGNPPPNPEDPGGDDGGGPVPE